MDGLEFVIKQTSQHRIVNVYKIVQTNVQK